ARQAQRRSPSEEVGQEGIQRTHARVGQTWRAPKEGGPRRKGEKEVIYKRGKFYWYEFEFNGKRYRKSTDILVGRGKPGKKSPKELARDVETGKRHELALAAVGIQPPAPEEPKPEKPTLSVWATQWLSTYAKVHCKFATHRLYKQVV